MKGISTKDLLETFLLIKLIIAFIVGLGYCESVMRLGASAAEEPDRTRSPPSNLEIFRAGYPRAFFFRASESQAATGRYTFEEWDSIFSRLGGIEGKVLDEEVPGRSRYNIDYFVRYKREHPEKLVLLHFNGRARDPRWNTEDFSAGHWLYFEGCRITKDVPAEDGETEIRVEDPTLFRVNIGRYGDRNEDIGLCMIGGDGRPEWNQSEQVQLISVDVDRRVIRVRRGCYGTEPRAFPANRSWAAAHVSEGPWGAQSNLMWMYNYSPLCPKDPQGRALTDILVDHVASHFLLGGKLESFDGLEFDVLGNYAPRPYSGGRGVDTDGDGVADDGWVGGLNCYGIGVCEFIKRLRERLGEDRLILADGHGPSHQRCFGLLNGIESEGWPSLSDHRTEDWSGGLNRHLFWNQNAREPVFHYINHKFVEVGLSPKDPDRMRPEVPFNVHRLVFAAAQFIDAAVCYSYAPTPEPGEAYGVWDELWKGAGHEVGWLGQPLGPPVRLALQKRDLLNGGGKTLPTGFLGRWRGEDVQFTVEDGSLKVSAKGENVTSLRFRLTNVPCEGPDLFVSLRIRAQAMGHYPEEFPRLVWMSALEGRGSTRIMTWANGKWFEAGFYFRDIRSQSVDLEFEVEGGEPVWLSNITVHAHPDAVYRVFEDGIVLANPSHHEYTFNLEAITPGRGYRRLVASSMQDTGTNDGSSVGGSVTLGPLDGLFLAVSEGGTDLPEPAQPSSSITPTIAIVTILIMMATIAGILFRR